VSSLRSHGVVASHVDQRHRNRRSGYERTKVMVYGSLPPLGSFRFGDISTAIVPTVSPAKALFKLGHERPPPAFNTSFCNILESFKLLVIAPPRTFVRDI
jgi:hypothetical protein